jgi:hypothetical protein
MRLQFIRISDSPDESLVCAGKTWQFLQTCIIVYNFPTSESSVDA